MTILDFCKNPSDEVDKTKKIVSLNRTQRRILYRKLTLRNVRSNPQGGWLVKTIMSNDEFEIFRKKGQGLYAWVTETQFNLMKDSILDLDWIKFGQYGSLNNNKTPDETITSEYRINEAIVILWAYRFTDDDIKNITKKYKNTDKWKNGPAYVVEQIVNKKITNKLPKSDGSGKETFWTSLPIIVSEVEKELNKKQLLIPFISSEDKEDAINKMITNPTKYFGLFATMRHGKSWDYLEYIKRKYVVSNILENHAIFCHDTKTYGGWKKKIEKSYSDCIDLIELKDNKDYDFSKTPKRNTIILISPQLISASSNNEDITNFEEKLKSLKESYDIQVENIFVDEAHNYFTPQWEKYYESILQAGQIILASGTAANLILKHQDKFDETNTFIWGIKELKKKLLEELNIDLKLEVKLIQLKNTDGSDFNIANLQSEDDGVLSNQYHFEEFVGKMINPNSKFSPIFSRERKHHIALFDTVNSAKEFKRLVQSSKYSDKIVPILVAGSKGRDANSEEEVNKLILEAESQGKRTITLTCGSMIRGVSERNWKSILNLSSKSTYEIYFQLFGRGFEFDNDLDNYIGQETKEERVIMWDYNPNRIYRVGAEFVDSMAKVNGDDQIKALKYFFEIIDITEYVEEGRTWSDSKSYEEIESKINDIVNKNTIRRGLTVNTCLDKRFDIDQLDSEWIEWAIKQKWSSNGKNGDKVRKQKLDLWEQNLLKQKTDHSKSQKDKTQRQAQKEILDLQEQVKRSFEQTLSKLDIVWAVYKSQGKVDYHIDELFKYYDKDEFLNGLGLPNKEVSKVFVETVKRFGLTGKINGKLKDSRIETIENFLNMDRKTLINTSNNGLDKWFDNGYAGDDTQLSVENWLLILEPFIKKLKLNELKTFHFPFAKSGSGILALTYLLKENSKKIFGRELTNQEIIESVSYEDKNTFFESLINTMGFSKTAKTKKDFIIINPPYSSGLHLDIFVKSFNDELNHDGTLICVHRETPVITKTPNPNKKTKEYRDIMINNTSEITFFDGNKVFHTAQFFAPLIISRVKKDSNKSLVKINSNHLKLPYSYEISDFNDAFIHSNVEKTIRIRKKLLDKVNNEQLLNFNEMSTKKIKNSPYYVNIKQIGGHGMVDGKINKDFYCLVSPKFEYDIDNQITDDINNCLTPAGRGGGIRANSYNEAVNIFEFMKTKSARFFISLTKIDQNIWDGDMLSILPYLDFTKKWNDTNIFEYFQLEDELIQYINEYIEPIYDYEKSN
jgi:hypothetical protein